ncbi:protoporphyrinogen oxidase [Agromyces protaetiae]|uniref:Protoporphyrinogen oxidase n=2 Tax=Agromyces protaetiae TaxID=2509455 RepID=A0A4P6FA60_9MICO|nr:protoporphyrinogen oxidase [Agromyces protaetiae]
MPDGKGGVKSAPLPKTGVLGIPANPLGEDVRAIIGWRGALRAYTDRLKPILRIGRAHSLGKLVRSRMGKQVLDRLVTPISSGVYSADPMDLDVDVVAPGLNEAMTRQGSLSGGVGELVEARKAGSAVLGVRGGMHRVVDALLTELARFEVSVVTAAEVTSLAAAGDPGAPRWRAVARIAAPETSEDHSVPDAATEPAAAEPTDLVVDARFAIVATPARSSRPLLREAVDGWVDAGDWPEPASVEIVTLVLEAPDLDGAPRGTGLLVAADTTGVGAKAFTHSSAKWAWLAETAAPRHVVRLSYGRAGAPNPLDGLDDDAVADLALADLSKLTGLRLDRSNLIELGRTAWRDALSHAALGQRERVEQLEETLAAVPGLEATGSWLSGTGLASVVPHARAAAARIRHLAVAERTEG